MPEPLGAAGFRFSPPRPLILFVVPLDEAPHLKPPRLRLGARKTQLAVRNSDLGRPSVFVDVRHTFPDWIPSGVAARRADADLIALRSGRVQIKERTAQMVVVAVDDE